jgi:hypothetical protein
LARAQVSEAVILMGGAKVAIYLEMAENGRWPQADESGQSLIALGVKTIGNYVESVHSNGINAVTARMRVTANSNIRNKTVSFQYHPASKFENGYWSCVRGLVDPIEDRYLPSTCLNSYQPE